MPCLVQRLELARANIVKEVNRELPRNHNSVHKCVLVHLCLQWKHTTENARMPRMSVLNSGQVLILHANCLASFICNSVNKRTCADNFLCVKETGCKRVPNYVQSVAEKATKKSPTTFQAHGVSWSISPDTGDTRWFSAVLSRAQLRRLKLGDQGWKFMHKVRTVRGYLVVQKGNHGNPPS